MTMDANPRRGTLPEVQVHDVRLLGTGASAPTKQLGRGITVTRNSTGNYRLTFADPPGVYVGMEYGLQAATPADIAGHTVIADTWVAPTSTADGYLDIVLYSAADAAHDLAANEYISLAIKFKRTGLT